MVILLHLVSPLHVVLEIASTHLARAAPVLPVFLMVVAAATPAASVMHAKTTPTSTATPVSMETSPAKATTSLEPPTLVKLIAPLVVVVHHVLLGSTHALVKMTLLLVRLVAVKVVRPAAPPAWTLLSPPSVLETLHLILAAWARAPVLVHSVTTTPCVWAAAIVKGRNLLEIRRKATYILLDHGLHDEAVATDLAVFNAVVVFGLVLPASGLILGVALLVVHLVGRSVGLVRLRLVRLLI